MKTQEINGLKYYTFSTFPENELTHGIFSRQGGVSPEHWQSLNLGGTNGDSRANVIENRRRIFKAMDREVESIFDVWQVHGIETVCADRPRPLEEPHKQADIILTNNPDITLFMRFADCVPIFLYDPPKKVIGIVHAGWQGTVKKAGSEAVRKMVSVYGSQPGDIRAGIGPSIGSHHYEIGEDVARRVKFAYKDAAGSLLEEKNGAIFFDLWKANRLNLEQEGVSSIEIAEICTACNTREWYSHRAEQGKTGRFGALLALKQLDGR